MLDVCHFCLFLFVCGLFSLFFICNFYVILSVSLDTIVFGILSLVVFFVFCFLEVVK